MPRGGSRPNTGGARPGAGRPRKNRDAGVAQSVELLPSKQNVEGSSPFARSKSRSIASFIPKPTQRRSVERMVAVGESHAVIASAFGLSQAELRRHFAVELAKGHARRRREIIDLMFQAAHKGNTAAQRRLEEMTAITPAAPEPKTAKAPVLGKKEQAEIDALTADEGTSWASILRH
jgi:hypothetical protein